MITFYRSIGKENFHYDDIFILDMLKNHLAFQLEKHHMFGEDEQEKLTVSQAVEKYNLTRRGISNQCQYTEKTYFKHLSEVRYTESCAIVQDD